MTRSRTHALVALSVLLVAIVVMASAASAAHLSGASSAAVESSAAPVPKPRIVFDDFSYTSTAQLESHRWIVRSGSGWPGVTGASFANDNVSFVGDPLKPGNSLMRLSSSTDGTPSGTKQTQVCHQRKYLAGTYAARVHFSDKPSSGESGDGVVETFYVNSPLRRSLDPKYSEMDFEYLPNGGWGIPAPTFYVTTWYTARLVPWYADNMSRHKIGSRDGWHTLVIQVSKGKVTYFIDGAKFASHGGKYYPRVPMSINFNLWFIDGGLLPAGTVRSYEEDVDWVFHQQNVVLSPTQVNVKVAGLRKSKVRFRDTVPAAKPQLVSRCNL